MRRQALIPPSPPAAPAAAGRRPHPVLDAAITPLLSLALVVLTLVLSPPGALAAEVLQVRGPSLLQVGDGNRSVPVELACINTDAEHRQAAVDWLRQQLPRRTRVQLRPVGQNDGRLLAQVRRLDSDDDLGSGLIAAGLAVRTPDCP